MDKRELTRIEGNLRSKYLEMPEEIYRAKGLVIMGRRIKSVIFTTDIAIIRSCNADAVLAVYPFTPQQIISQSIINVAPMPVFVGVGGGITNGMRSAMIAKDAEGDGAWGVVVNAPVTNENIQMIANVVDIPIIATVIHESVDVQARLDAGVSILNVSASIFQTVVNYIVNLITMIVFVIINVARAFGWLFVCIQYLPGWLIAFVVVPISLSIVFQILNKGS